MKTWQRLLSEGLGTAALLCVVIGSGIMAEQLAQGNAAVALLGNTLATVFALYVLIETLGPVSGAHFNPLVTAFMAWRDQWPLLLALAYVMSQLVGAACGAWLAHAMFGVEIFQWSDKVRTGTGQWLAEAVATAGLLSVILLSPAQKVASLVAAYIGAAYWFTASTSFANPAAVFGRMMSNSFAGIAPENALGFALSEISGWVVVVVVYKVFNSRQ
ncbi:MAG: aquaporin family protein [Betaproteobacteria bacterium]|jgi:glycerol uptake facilitator-like aquaporin|nr:aquaporin family protein [Betaproteobacteria bacterium]